MNENEIYEQMTPSPLEVENSDKNKNKGFNLITMLTSIPKAHLVKYITIFALGCGIIISLVFLSFKANELSNLNRKNEELLKEISDLEDEEDKAKQEKYNLEVQLTDLENDKRQLDNELFRVNQQKVEYEIKNKRNENLLIDLNNQIRDIDTQFEVKTEENKKLKEQVDKQGELPKEALDEINKLKEEIAKIENEIDTIKQQNHKESGITSDIIDAEQFELLLTMINNADENPPEKFIKIYDTKVDGFNAKTFHSKCDKYEGTLVILRDIHDNVIAGYTTQNWGGQGYKQDVHSFLANLSNKKYYKIDYTRKAIQANPTCLTVFGDGDLLVCEKESRSDFPKSYGGGSTGSELTGSTALIIIQMEVYGFTE